MPNKNQMAARMAQRREDLWPGSAHRVWPGKKEGWFKAPRVLPIVVQIIDRMCGTGKKASAVYIDILSRVRDEGIADIGDEPEAAYLSGFATERGVRTWRERMAELVKLGFIEARKRGGHSFGTVMVVDPLPIIARLHEKRGGPVNEEMWTTLTERCTRFNITVPQTPKPPMRRKKEETKVRPKAARK